MILGEIAVSLIIYKVFEHCLLEGFQSFLCSGDNQIGFRKGLGCSYAIRTVCNFVDQYNKAGSTANICALDFSKHLTRSIITLYIKLMKC